MKKIFLIFILLTISSKIKAQENVEPFTLSYKYSTSMNKLENGDIQLGESYNIDFTVFFYINNTNKCKVIMNSNPPEIWHNIAFLRYDEKGKYTSFKFYSDKGERLTGLLYDRGNMIIQSSESAILYSTNKVQ
jgi:hypothetical protein